MPRLQALERVIDAQGVTDCFALVKDGMPRSTVLQHLETELLGAKGDMATSVLGCIAGRFWGVAILRGWLGRSTILFASIAVR